TDQHHLAALARVALALQMHFGYERTGRVDHRQRALPGIVDHGAGDAMGAEDSDAARRNVGDLLDEAHALRAQSLDHVAVVHDLVSDIDGGAELLERPLDDRDRALNASTNPSRLGQDHPHSVPPPPPARADVTSQVERGLGPHPPGVDWL